MIAKILLADDKPLARAAIKPLLSDKNRANPIYLGPKCMVPLLARSNRSCPWFKTDSNRNALLMVQLGNRLEHSKELGTVELATLLAREQVIRPIGWPLPQPTSDSRHFIQQWLSTMLEKGLNRQEWPFQTSDGNGAGLLVDVGQF
jgi:hypothetical protein